MSPMTNLGTLELLKSTMREAIAFITATGNRLASLEARLAAAEDFNRQAEERIAYLESEVADLESEVDALRINVTAHQTRLWELENR